MTIVHVPSFCLNQDLFMLSQRACSRHRHQSVTQWSIQTKITCSWTLSTWRVTRWHRH